MILWRNVPARAWLWWHGNHRAQNLAGPLWTCSCGSTQLRPDHRGEWKP